MRIYLARHGQTEVGEDGLYLPEAGLTRTGHEQAAELAVALRDTGIQIAFTSGLRRAQETAEHFSRVLGLPSHVVTALNEIEVGDIVSASQDEKRAIVSHDHDLDFTKFGGEEPTSFFRRVIAGYEDMVKQAEDKGADTIAAFIHGGSVGAIIDHLAGVAFDYRRRGRMPNCAFAVVDLEVRLDNPLAPWHTSHLTSLT